MFRRQLGDGIRRQGQRRIGFPLRETGRGAIGTRAGGVDDSFDFGIPRRQQYIQGPIHADAIGTDRIGHAAGNRRQGGLMKNPLHAAHRRVHCLRIGDIPFDHLDSIADVSEIG